MSSQNVLKRVLSSRMMAKVLLKFDKTTAIVVGACWMVAFIMIIFAGMSVHSVLEAKKEAAEAIIATPVLPKTTMTPIGVQEQKLLVARLKRDFPELTYTVDPGGNISIVGPIPRLFQEWIGVLSYLDAMAPQYRWEFVSMCVGKCKNDFPLQASVTGNVVSFALPATTTK